MAASMGEKTWGSGGEEEIVVSGSGEASDRGVDVETGARAGTVGQDAARATRRRRLGGKGGRGDGARGWALSGPVRVRVFLFLFFLFKNINKYIFK
jgi:hypothetical protein